MMGPQDLAPGGRVVVAMSGGVDSACVAALLVEAGYEVIGITLQLYDHGAAVGKRGACCAGAEPRENGNSIASGQSGSALNPLCGSISTISIPSGGGGDSGCGSSAAITSPQTGNAAAAPSSFAGRLSS